MCTPRIQPCACRGVSWQSATDGARSANAAGCVALTFETSWPSITRSMSLAPTIAVACMQRPRPGWQALATGRYWWWGGGGGGAPGGAVAAPQQRPPASAGPLPRTVASWRTVNALSVWSLVRPWSGGTSSAQVLLLNAVCAACAACRRVAPAQRVRRHRSPPKPTMHTPPGTCTFRKRRVRRVEQACMAAVAPCHRCPRHPDQPAGLA